MSKFYQTKNEMKYKSEEVWFPLSECVLAWDLDFHELMLNDHIRMIAYEKAIKEVVKPGMKVVDLGTGTGILSLWALEAGASKVYGIDVNTNVSKKALDRIAKAGFSDRYKLLNGLSYDINLPEKVDIIISEILGNLADNEGMTPILNDARKRFLKDGALFLPSQVSTYITPISSEIIHQQVSNKTCRGISEKYNLDELLRKLKIDNQFNLYYDVIIPQSAHLSTPKLVREFKFDGKDASEYVVNTSYIAESDGVLTGFKGYFIAQLSPNTVLDISGDDVEARNTPDCFKHCYMPIIKPIKVQKGDQIQLTYSRYYPEVQDSVFRQCYSWTGSVIRNGITIGNFSQKMG